MEIFLFFFIFVGLPWFVISLIKNYFEQRAREKEALEIRQAHARNPSLKHEEAIRRVNISNTSVMNLDDLLELSNNLFYSRETLHQKIENYSKKIEYKTPITNSALEIHAKIVSDTGISEVQKTRLINLINNRLGEKIRVEAINKEKYEESRRVKLNQLKLELIDFEAKCLRRKSLIDRLAGEYSYVCIDAGSPLFEKVNAPFVFKSNNWEYINGDYILFGGKSYNEGVINLYKNLYKLKRLKKIKKINNLADPRTV